MQCIVTYAAGMYYYQYKVSYETYILNFGYLPSINLHLRERGCEDPWLFVEAKRGLWVSKYGKWWSMPVPKHTMNEHGWVEAVSRINEIKDTVSLTD
jgi:hypothetical protein